MTVSGVLNWTAGTMSGSGKTIIASSGTLNMSGAAAKQLGRVLQNDGMASWTGTGPLQMSAGTFNNNGSFAANSTSLLDCFGNTGVNAFNNAGAFTQQGAGETRFRLFVTSVAFNNTGTVNVQGGKLGLNGGGIDSGLLAVQSGATL